MSWNYEQSFAVSNWNHYNIRNNSTFRIPSFNIIFKGKKSVSYLGPKLWNQVPEEIKSLESLTIFFSCFYGIRLNVTKCRIAGLGSQKGNLEAVCGLKTVG